jgi:hypothetical protein
MLQFNKSAIYQRSQQALIVLLELRMHVLGMFRMG